MHNQARPNSGQLNRTGKTFSTASIPPGSARTASAMNTYNASTVPMKLTKYIFQLQPNAGATGSNRVSAVPQTIIRPAMQTGASTGPHHGNGSKKRMSQSRRDFGHWQMIFKKT